MFSDLETDYINPIDFCNKMNKVRGLILLAYGVLTKVLVYFFKSVRSPRSLCPRIPGGALPLVRSMDSFPP